MEANRGMEGRGVKERNGKGGGNGRKGEGEEGRGGRKGGELPSHMSGYGADVILRKQLLHKNDAVGVHCYQTD